MAKQTFKTNVRVVGTYASRIAAYNPSDSYDFTLKANTREEAVTLAKQKMRSVLLVTADELPASHLAVRFTH